MATSVQEQAVLRLVESDLGERPLRIRTIAPGIGAEIEGLRLDGDVDDETIAAVRRTVLARRVVFFRGQNLDSDGHIAFARRFGTLTRAHPTIPAVDGVPTLYDLDSEGGAHANMWHSDVTFVDQPPDFSFLRVDILPEAGGDTLWANTVAGFQSLSPELQQLATALRALHSNDYDYVRVDLSTLEGELDPVRLAHMRQFASTVYRTEHPVARVHPETGEHALLLGSFAQRLVGYTTAESVDIIRLFQSYVTKPEHTVRWHWETGDVALWDNRSTQHYANYDYGTERRRVQRVTTVGSVPIGIDGRVSQALQGDASTYNQELA